MKKYWHVGNIAVTTFCALSSLLSVTSFADDATQVAPVRPVTDTYFGTDVVDNYRYLENLKDPEVAGWMKAQANHTRTTLDSLSGRAALQERIHALSNADLRRGGFVRIGNRYFYMQMEPGAQQPKLFYRDGLNGGEHLLIDPSLLGKGTSTHYALDFFQPSRDGKLLAYGLSAGGSEESVLHVQKVETGEIMPDAIDRTNDNVVSWLPDNRSFFYLRYVKPGPNVPKNELLYNARTYLHTLGSHTSGDGDPPVFGRGVAKNLEVPDGQGTYVVLGRKSNFAVAVANHNMDENPSTLYVAPLSKVNGAATPWRKFADVEDGVTQFTLFDDKLYFLSQKGASHFRLLSVSLAHPDLKQPTVVVPEGKSVLTGFTIAREGIYLQERVGAISNVKLVSLDGKDTRPITLPFEGAVYGLVTDPQETGVLFNMQSWVHPASLISYDAATDKTSDTGLIPSSKIDTSQLESKEVLAVSYDGTQVPLSIIYKKGIVLDGSHPTILEGYGSYGLSQDSFFSATMVAWLERGGIFAVAHIRGGGENGEDWHRDGQMRTKLNTEFDMIACGQYLVDTHYTASKYLAAQGGSAGGITVGGAFTRRPDLFSVILDQVGMSDTLRSETEPNGPPNISEFGSTKTAEGFHGLYAMSPYEHVRDGTAYPAILFTTGANDPRVSPWHMAKMTARTQAATSSKRPVLLRVDYDAGHGIGSNRSQREVETADLWAFTLWQMGDPAFQPTTKP
ncbi:MAG TPA: prolyl oligopeptidase family serine peptidase [Burkholderiaceae bacterium]|nr:prolyl oligopeptidase family serine peptidase [Burkholderiaceae bacterium]